LNRNGTYIKKEPARVFAESKLKLDQKVPRLPGPIQAPKVIVEEIILAPELNKNVAKKAARQQVRKQLKVRGPKFTPAKTGKNAKKKALRKKRPSYDIDFPRNGGGMGRMDPVAKNPFSRSRYFRPVVHSDHQGMRVRGQDLWFVYNVPGTSPSPGDVLNSLNMNPASIQVSRLDRLAACFQKFKFNMFRIHYETMSSFASSGGFGMYVDDDCATNYANSGNNLEIASAHTNYRWFNISGQAACTWLPRSDPTRYWINEGAAIDPRTACQGRAFVFCATGMTAATAGGVFWIEYDVDLYDWALDAASALEGEEPLFIVNNVGSFNTTTGTNGDWFSQLMINGNPQFLYQYGSALFQYPTPLRPICFNTIGAGGQYQIYYGISSNNATWFPGFTLAFLILSANGSAGNGTVQTNVFIDNARTQNATSTTLYASLFSSLGVAHSYTLSATNPSLPWYANMKVSNPTTSGATYNSFGFTLITGVYNFDTLAKMSKKKVTEATYEDIMEYVNKRLSQEKSPFKSDDVKQNPPSYGMTESVNTVYTKDPYDGGTHEEFIASGEYLVRHCVFDKEESEESHSEDEREVERKKRSMKRKSLPSSAVTTTAEQKRIGL